MPTLNKMISRSRLAINQGLKEKWMNNRKHHLPESLDSNREIALIVDCTTVEIFKPTGTWDESKIYWDGKNKIYGLKKEVAISSNFPYQALFIEKSKPASFHDYRIFKENYFKFVPYLQKSFEETQKFPETELSWSILCDLGYIGPEMDTPGLRKIVIPNSDDSLNDSINSTRLRSLRVQVERFFGRLYKSWFILFYPYRFFSFFPFSHY